MGMPALAMTDHGNVFGAFDFWKKATAAGIKPIIGVEAYVTPRTHRSDRTRVKWGQGGGDDVSGGGAFTHMTLLAETTAGMHNLFRLNSRASLEGFFYKPRMDRELLQTYAGGLIATTGCPSGEVQTFLRLGKYDEARAAAAEFRDIFGAGNYFLELMEHGLEIESRVRADLLRLAKDLALPMVATNDLHYTRKEDAPAHEVLLCVQSGSTMADPNRFRLDGDDYYLKSPAEMRQVWRELPEACDNTLLIAERCEVSFAEGEGRYMPRFPVPDGESEQSWFVKEVEAGLLRRYPGGARRRAAQAGRVRDRGHLQQGLRGLLPGRGRLHQLGQGPGHPGGPGAAVRVRAPSRRTRWGITDLDPLQHGLIFERFLNPERMSMPDFDVDFDERRRGEVIRYVTEKYGDDRVAQIVTYGTIKAKQAMKDSARVLGYPYALGDQLTKLMPPAIMGKDIPLGGIFDPTHKRYSEAGEFRARYETDPDAKRVVDTARGLENLKRQWGVHAAGVIMSSEPLLDVIPIMKREQDGQIITQFDYPSCEALGLVKMDFLGLRNLTILDDALRNIVANRSQVIDLDALSKDLTDQPTYDLLARGETLGVFQFDGGPMRSLLRAMKPDNFEDISAVGALYRPGPMGAGSHTKYALRKNGLEPITPDPPRARRGAGGGAGPDLRADRLPGAGHPDRPEAGRLHARQGRPAPQGDGQEEARGPRRGVRRLLRGHGGQRLLDGCHQDALGHPRPVLRLRVQQGALAAYGLVSYWTAYLKANFPAEYMAALLTSVRDDKDKSALYLNECRRMGIKVLPPDVNESDADYTPRGTDIRFGLSAIRNVGENVVASIAATRAAKGRFTDFYDFLRKVDPVACNKKTVESLIKAGAFDSLGDPRRGPAQRARRGRSTRSCSPSATRRTASSTCSARATEDGPSEITVTPAIPIGEVGQERAAPVRAGDARALRVRPPLFGVEHVLPAATDCSIAALTGSGRRARRVARDRSAAWCSGLQRKVTKKGDVWAIADHRGPRGRDRGHVLPPDLPAVRDLAGRGRGRDHQGPAGPARRRAQADRHGALAAGPVRGPRGRWSSRCPWCAAPRRWSSGSRRCSAPTRAPPRCTCGCRPPPGPPCCGSTTGSGSTRARP
jgi:DNA polymerase-3 subunit alpha